MEAKDVRNLQEAYLSVYQPQYISEEVEIATEYFYEMGLNEHGIDILIEELGEDEFVDWINDIVEESYLEEASQTRLQKMADKKGKILVGPKGSRPQSTTKAAIKKHGGTVRGGISGGVSGVIKRREGAVASAQTKQPASSSTPAQTKQGIGARIGAAFKQGMERHRQATQTAGSLAGQTAQTAGKLARGLGQAWQSASDSKLGQAGRVAVKQGLRRQQKAIDTLAPKVGRAAGRAAANVPAIRDTYKAGQKLGRALRREDYEYILAHLLDEGYAETQETAEVIMVNMSEEWRDNIIQQLDEISDRRVEAARNKLIKRTDRALGSREVGAYSRNVSREVRMNAAIERRNKRTGSNVEPSFTRRHQ